MASLFLIVAVAVLTGFFTARKRVGTASALRRSVLALAMFGVGVAAIYVKQNYGVRVDPLLAALPLIAAAAEWYVMLTWPLRKRRAGTLLEDLGPHPSRNTARLLGVSALLGTFAQIAASISNGTFRTRDVALQILLFTSAIMSWYLAHSHVYATTEGILRFDKLIRWSKIESHEWVRGGTVDFLIIRSKRQRLFGREIKLEVPVEQRPTLEKWLSQHSLKQQPVNVE